MHVNWSWSIKILNVSGYLFLITHSFRPAFTAMLECPSSSSQEIQTFRDALALKLTSSDQASSVYQNIESCFSQNIPACLKCLPINCRYFIVV